MMSVTAARVFALLDSSAPGRAALLAAVELAARRSASLQALYVEDEALLRSAAFPFCSELDAVTGRPRPLDVTTVETRMRREAEQVRSALEQAVQEHAIQHQLDVVRGLVVREALERAHDSDLLVIGRTSATRAFSTGMGTSCRRIVTQASCPVLVWNGDTYSRSGRLLLVADPEARFSDVSNRSISMLTDWLRERGLVRDVQQMPELPPGRLLRLLESGEHSALVLPRHLLQRFPDAEMRRLDRVDIPVLVVP